MTLNEDDDFGFSAVSEEELRKYENELKAAVDETTTTAVELEDRLAKLYAAIMPLLNNLEKKLKNVIHYPPKNNYFCSLNIKKIITELK